MWDKHDFDEYSVFNNRRVKERSKILVVEKTWLVVFVTNQLQQLTVPGHANRKVSKRCGQRHQKLDSLNTYLRRSVIANQRNKNIQLKIPSLFSGIHQLWVILQQHPCFQFALLRKSYQLILKRFGQERSWKKLDYLSVTADCLSRIACRNLTANRTNVFKSIWTRKIAS